MAKAPRRITQLAAMQQPVCVSEQREAPAPACCLDDLLAQED